MGVTFPNEGPGYRAARNRLLQREVALRREMEAVATEIRALPPGGAVPEDYEFDHLDAEGAPAKVRLSELFRPGTDTLIIYHYMFPRHRSDQRRGPSSGPMAQLPLEEGPCPSCTALLDNWEGAVPHVEGLGANVAAVAKAPIERVAAFAAHRGWRNLKLLSAANNSFKRDYHGEDEQGQQVPICCSCRPSRGRIHGMSARWSRCGPSWTSLPVGGRTRTSRSNTNAVGLSCRRTRSKHRVALKLRASE
jgi:predicted dithiol-disulfide oxidoreductase (DUF899 family)